MSCRRTAVQNRDTELAVSFEIVAKSEYSEPSIIRGNGEEKQW
jgi:hypothetical protein